jgi:hypothetical protein
VLAFHSIGFWCFDLKAAYSKTMAGEVLLTTSGSIM